MVTLDKREKRRWEMDVIGISIVIPVYQNLEELESCLNSVLDSKYENYEIIVVDDHSQPALSTLIPPHDKIRFLCQDRRQGAAAARNRGVGESRNEVIYFLDSDVEIFPENLERLARHFSERETLAVAGISDPTPLNDVYMAHYQALFEYFLHYHPNVEYVDIFNPRNAAIRKDIFLKLDGFDTSFATTLEEAEFAQRLRQNNVQVKNDPQLVVRHKYPATLYQALRNHFERGFTWLRIYLKKDARMTKVGGTATVVVKGIVMHFLFFIAMAGCLWDRRLGWAAFMFYLLHLKYFLPFYRLCLEKKGALFLLRAMTTKLIMSLVMGLSQVVSLATLPLYKKNVLKG